MEGEEEHRNRQLLMSAMLAEYGAMREEILETMRAQYSILAVGTGMIATVIGVSFTQTGILGISLFLIVPFISVSVLSLWSVEGIRRLRAASYIREVLATKINSLVDGSKEDRHQVMGFEFWFRENPSKELRTWNGYFYRLNQVGVIGLFGVSSGVALILALFKGLAAGLGWDDLTFTIAFIGVLESGGLLYISKMTYETISAGRRLIVHPMHPK